MTIIVLITVVVIFLPVKKCYFLVYYNLFPNRGIFIISCEFIKYYQVSYPKGFLCLLIIL